MYIAPTSVVNICKMKDNAGCMYFLQVLVEFMLKEPMSCIGAIMAC